MGRALRQLVQRGQLLKIGLGIYSRAIKSPFDDRPIPPGDLSTLREALTRVGIETFPSRLEQDYNSGRTTQVPTGRVGSWASSGASAAESAITGSHSDSNAPGLVVPAPYGHETDHGKPALEANQPQTSCCLSGYPDKMSI